MPPLAIGLGVASVVGSVAGSLISANAQGKAGDAQVAAAQTQVDYAKQAAGQQRVDRDTAVGLAQQFGGMSADEYSSIQKIVGTQGQALTASLASIQKQQAALDAVDPQVKAAGGSLLDLLNGKASAMLAPAQAQLAQQREALKGQLASQLGPGYATSSAGIQALLQFDQQSAMTQAQIQQSAVQQATSTYSTLFGQQQSGFNSVGGQTQNAFGAAQDANKTVFGAYNGIQNRLDNSVLGAFNANSPNYGLPVQAQGNAAAVAGNPFASQNTIGGAIGGLAGGLGQIAGQAYGQYNQDQTLQKYLGAGAGYGLPAPTPVAMAPASYTPSFQLGPSSKALT